MSRYTEKPPHPTSTLAPRQPRDGLDGENWSGGSRPCSSKDARRPLSRVFETFNGQRCEALFRYVQMQELAPAPGTAGSEAARRVSPAWSKRLSGRGVGPRYPANWTGRRCGRCSASNCSPSPRLLSFAGPSISSTRCGRLQSRSLPRPRGGR